MAYFDAREGHSGGIIDDLMGDSGWKWRERLVFVAQIGYLVKPRALGRYTVLEPAYFVEWMEMLGVGR